MDRDGDEDDADDPWFRPVWSDTEDETDTDLPPEPLGIHSPAPPRPGRMSQPGTVFGDAAALLAPLAEAADALARLDAATAAASPPVRAGLIARLALREAAGWLARQGAWVHPSDLALRALGLAGHYEIAALTGSLARTMPHTARNPGAWQADAGVSPWTLLTQEEAVTRALALARLLPALPRRHDPFAEAEVAARFLASLGVRDPDPDHFAAWRQGYVLRTRPDRRAPVVPDLLHAAQAAAGWMESGVVDEPDALAALAIAASLLARWETLRVVPLPVWTAWPMRGGSDDGGLPRRRGTDGGWAEHFLGLVADSARAGLQDLERLQAMSAQAAPLLAQEDPRSALPRAWDALLSAPALTPGVLAGQLGLTLQATNRLLHRLVTAGLVREITGRKSFRAFAVAG